MTIASFVREPALHVFVALAAEAPSPSLSPSAGVAVQIALIGALAPVILVIVNEIFRRWRSKSTDDPPRDGLLAPVEEVPRHQFDSLLDRIGHLDNVIGDQSKRHEAERQSWRSERGELEREIDRCRDRCSNELDRLRERLSDEIERRSRAEALLSMMQSRGSDGSS